MDNKALFAIKEKMLRELSESMETLEFKSEADKEAYYNNSMEAIMKFYMELQNRMHKEAA